MLLLLQVLLGLFLTVRTLQGQGTKIKLNNMNDQEKYCAETMPAMTDEEDMTEENSMSESQIS